MNAAEFFFEVHAKELFLDSEPYDGVKESLERLKKEGHKIIIATWQYTLNNKLFTLMFLEKNDIPYDDICFTRDKWMIKSDWMIDDNPEFIMDERDKSKKILIRMPYNKGIRMDATRCDNLKKAIDFILKIENTKSFLKIEHVEEAKIG